MKKIVRKHELTCPNCNGLGRIYSRKDAILSIITCGKVDKYGHECPTCGGLGIVLRKDTTYINQTTDIE